MRHLASLDAHNPPVLAALPLLLALPIILFVVHFLAVGRLSASSSLSPPPAAQTKPHSASKPKSQKSRTRSKAKQSRNHALASVATAKLLQSPSAPPALSLSFSATPYSRDMSYPSSPTSSVASTLVEDPKIRQSFDALLVLDVEATCSQGVGFDFPNEIIEFPVVLLRWADKEDDGRASELVPVAEFRSYVRPTWRQTLTPFCTALTGITQAEVDPAPTWPEVLQSFNAFLEDNGLIDARTGASLQKFMFCCDGPYDVRDFVVKQCYISKIPVPNYFQKDILDIRKAVTSFVAIREQMRPMPSTATVPSRSHPGKRQSLNIHAQLGVLNLPPFIGRPHCGIDDTRNIARILIELARTPMRIEANTFIHPNRKWWWMTRDGRVDFPEDVKPYSGPEYQNLYQEISPASSRAPSEYGCGSAGSAGSAASFGSFRSVRSCDTASSSSAGSSAGSSFGTPSYGSFGSFGSGARSSDTASTAGSCRSQLSSSCGSPPLKASAILTAPPSPTLSMW